MALSDKNIIITPNIGAAADPKIVFSGADANTTAQNITLTSYPTANGTLSFDGSAGQLFSITNSLSGTIFSVNDVSGIPSIEVLDTGNIKLAQYNGSIGIGNVPSGTYKLEVTGSSSFNTNATGFVKHAATAVPTVDMLQITNIGFPIVTAGISALQINYIGGAAAVESSASRIDLTPGTTTGGTWNGYRTIVTTDATTGVTLNGTKFDTIATPGLGTTNAIYVGTGWDSILNYNGTSIISGTGGGAFTTLSASGQTTHTVAATTAGGGGSIYLNGTANRIDFNNNGANVPTLNTVSIGTKIVLYPNVGASAVDFALGIESGAMWSSVATSTNQFKWYAGTTAVASLSGTGAFSSSTLTSTVATGTSPFTVTSTTAVANLSIGGTAAGLSTTLAVSSGGTGGTVGGVEPIQPITASVGAFALTCTLNHTILNFRAPNLTSGNINTVSIASAISVTVPSTVTLATYSAQQSRIALIALYNGGTPVLGVTSMVGSENLDETTLMTTNAIGDTCTFTGSIAVTTGILTISSFPTGTFALGMVLTGTGITTPIYIKTQLTGIFGAPSSTYSTNTTLAVASTTLTGRAGIGVYTTNAVTASPFRVVGYIESTQATAGTWATAPSTIQGQGGQALAAMSSLGYGQTWQAVTRTSGTTYYNTTGKPIECLVSAVLASSTLSVGAYTSASLGSTSQFELFSFTVPAGMSYSLTGVTTIVWQELR